MTVCDGIVVALRAWAASDLHVTQRLLGDPAMTEHIGGPETPEQIERRHDRYLAMTDPAEGAMLAVILPPDETAVGQIGYWEHAEIVRSPSGKSAGSCCPATRVTRGAEGAGQVRRSRRGSLLD